MTETALAPGRQYESLQSVKLANIEGVRTTARITARGEVVLYELVVPLRHGQHTWAMPHRVKDAEGRWRDEPRHLISAEGYKHIARYMSLQLIPPPTIQLDANRVVPNPYIERDADGTMRRVHVRTIAVGRVPPAGNLIGRAYSLTMDCPLHWLESVLAHYKRGARDEEGAQHPWISLMPGPDPPDRDRVWKGWRGPGNVWVFCDIGHPQFARVWAEHLNLLRFGERRAQTICDRNAIRMFFPQTEVPAENPRVYVPVWIDRDRDLEQVMKRARLLDDGDLEVDGSRIPIVQQASGEPEPEDAAPEAVSEGPDECDPSERDELFPSAPYASTDPPAKGGAS